MDFLPPIVSGVKAERKPPNTAPAGQREELRMKKALATILAATVLCGVCATGVLAAGHHGGAWSTATARVCSWADGSCANHTCRQDADGDGVCDVCGNAVTCWGDTDGDGVCDSCGTSHTCRNDADGDGTCDVCGAACAAGTNAHHGHGAGHGRCGR